VSGAGVDGAPADRPRRRLAERLADHPRRVLALTLLLTAAALWPASRLRLTTDLPSLLPRDAPAAAAYRDFLATFGGFEKVFVIVRSAHQAAAAGAADAGALTDAAARLAEELAKSPEVAAARAGLTPDDEAFFLRWIAPRAPLLLPAADAAGFRAEVARRLAPEEVHRRVGVLRRTLTSPAGGFAAPFLTADPLGFAEGLLAAAGASLPLDPVSGAFVSRRGDAALVVITPARAELDPAGGGALAAALARAEAVVAGEARAAGVRLEVSALGGPLYAAHDERIIREDLTRITVASVVTVALLLFLGFEGLYAPLALFAVTAVGLIWAAAIASLWLGSVTVVGIGFIATLLGMGVDYGIHGGARFRLLRLGGEGRREALVGSLRQAGPAVVAATLTTAAALAALSLAHFRPLRELGQVLALGILAILAATATLGAALAALFPRAPLLAGGAFLWRRLWMPGIAAVVGFAGRRPRAVLAAALAVSLAAAAGLPRLSLNADLRTLRPADPEAAQAERLLVESFGLGLDTTTVVVRGATLDAALDRAAAARGVLASALGPGAEITTPSDWRVGGERLAGRLRLLAGLPFARAAADLERELGAAGVRVERFAGAIAALRRLDLGEDPGAPPAAAWPSWMSELVRREARGGWAVAVHARAPAGVWAAGPPPAVLARLAAAAPGAAVASAPRVGAELRDLALGDLTRLSIVAAAFAAGVLAVAFWRRTGEALLAALPLGLGFLWTFGFWGLAGRDIDLLCIATLPVLVGTGVDLGVYAVYRNDRLPGGIAGAVERSGVALTLAALTTTAGFGSLDSSRVPGLANAGVIVALGVVLCLVASLFVLPAIEALAKDRRGRTAAATAPLPEQAAGEVPR